MKTIVLTTFPERKRICVAPRFLIFHQPRKTILTIGGKPAFRHTTIMSVLNPIYRRELVEEYADVVRMILECDPDFVEFRHGETGTLFLFHPDFFELAEPGNSWPDDTGTVDKLCIVSLWNPGLWVPIVEPTFDDACAKLGHELD